MLNKEIIKDVLDIIDHSFVSNVDSKYSSRFYKNRESNKIYDDVVVVEIAHLYFYIIQGLFKEGIINNSFESDIRECEYFILNKKYIKDNSTSEYDRLKRKVNSQFGRMRKYQSYITLYIDKFYSKFIEEYNDIILYINVDSIILKYNDNNCINYLREVGYYGISINKVNCIYFGYYRYTLQLKSGEFFSNSNEYNKKEHIDIIRLHNRKKNLSNIIN